MVAQVKKNLLVSRLGNEARAVHEEVKKQATPTGNASLPEGVEGVAQLKELKIGEYKDGKNKGKLFFMGVGIVVYPKVFNGLTIAGRRTQIGPEALCNTPSSEGKRKTFKEHYAWMIGQLQLLGVTNMEQVPFDQVEAVMEMLKNKKPFFAFHTWKGKKQTTGKYAGKEPMVQHMWDGRCDYVEGQTPEEVAAGGLNASDAETNGTTHEEGVQQLEYDPQVGASDETTETGEQWYEQAAEEATEEAEGETEEGTESTETEEGVDPFEETEGETEEGTESTETEEGVDPFEETEGEAESEADDSVESLLARAINEEEEAKDKLQKLALEAGVSLEQIESATSWDEVVALMTKAKETPPKKVLTKPQPAPTKAPPKEAQKNGKAAPVQAPQTKAEAPPKEEFIPQRGKTCKYKPDPKAKPIDCEIMAVNESLKIVNLRNLATKTDYKGVKWEKIS